MTVADTNSQVFFQHEIKNTYTVNGHCMRKYEHAWIFQPVNAPFKNYSKTNPGKPFSPNSEHDGHDLEDCLLSPDADQRIKICSRKGHLCTVLPSVLFRGGNSGNPKIRLAIFITTKGLKVPNPCCMFHSCTLQTCREAVIKTKGCTVRIRCLDLLL